MDIVIFLALTSSYLSENTLGSLRSGLFHSRSNSGGDTDGIPPQKQYACLWNYVRHIVSFPRGKGYFASRVNYYSNSDCSFHLIRLIVSSDISVNPGPENCVVCPKTVAQNHRVLSSDQCDSWCRIKCGDVTLKQYREFQQMGGFSWICPPCLLSVFPFSNTTLNSTINSSIDSESNDGSHDDSRGIYALQDNEQLENKRKNCNDILLCHLNIKVTFLLAKHFSDLDNPDCLDFRASRNKNLK